MRSAIAIVGLACRYPDADTPGELWENVLAQRRAFRRIPAGRLRLEDYFSEDGETPDTTYGARAAVLEGFELDRTRFRIAASTYRVTDTAHWLALQVAADALADAGFAEGEGLPAEATGVLVGNTLTGEFTRAHVLRLRWPYVRRQLAAALAEEGWDEDRRRDFLTRFEASYKAPFPETTEESLAGGLSNTIAGRIANYFDLGGGGYTVDGACASSLLAVVNVCSALVSGELDVALAGGVDLSLDPFELVGFARTRALARGEMRVYDRRSAGFVPGEGAGFAVLQRHADALAQGRRIYAVIRGWGISSDGRGGLTRPEAEGQLLALRRAYRRAGFGIDSVALVEGHGTGTAVGDATELRTLNLARAEAAGGRDAPPAAIGSVKALIGHTKAAAGVAGLIKAALALHHQVLPPSTGSDEPHPELDRGGALRLLEKAEPWPAASPLRAAVSAMGFGGINAHLALESTAEEHRRDTLIEPSFLAAPQDAEVFFLASSNEDELAVRAERLAAVAAGLSEAEMGDLAAELVRRLPSDKQPTVRAAVLAAGPAELAARLETLGGWLRQGRIEEPRLDTVAGIFLARPGAAPRVGFLFPGQGSPVHLDGGTWRRRFAVVDELYERSALPRAGDGVETSVAQPAIVTASLSALAVLKRLGIEAEVALGHSLGELVALCWAGVFNEPSLLRLAAERGRAMAELREPGAMASVGAGAEEVEQLIADLDSGAVVTALNAPRQTVVSGATAEVEALVEEARRRGRKALSLQVSHAFHSPLMAPAAEPFQEALAKEEVCIPKRRVASTVTGAWLEKGVDLRALLTRQLTSPVRFSAALRAAATEVDLFLELGSGQVLTGLVRRQVGTPVVALDAGSPSLQGLLRAVGALFVLGAPLDEPALFADRFTRPFDPDRERRFLVNPCELAPEDNAEKGDRPSTATPPPRSTGPAASPLEVVRGLIVRRSELPASVVTDTSRLLSDLHLNSIAVGELVTAAARELSLPPPAAPLEYADATVGEVARTFDELREQGATLDDQAAGGPPAGVDTWVRPFTVELRERTRPPPPAEPGTPKRPWKVLAPGNHDFGEELARAFSTAAGEGGVVVFLSGPDGPFDQLVEAGRSAAVERSGAFVLVHQGSAAAAFARTLHLEVPEVAVTVAELPASLGGEAEVWSRRVVAEALGTRGYSDTVFDEEGRRFEPVLRLLPEAPEDGAGTPLAAGDVVLVTGGGKGIGAECALALARRTGARLALVGRSPSDDAELGRNLERFAAHGVEARYLRADVTDREAVAAAVAEAEAALGPVRGVVHSAGTNVPRLVTSLESGALEATLAPKLDGLRNVLSAVDDAGLKLLLGFGSILARTGLPGEADYALANEALRREIEAFAARHGACRSLCVEWSVWSGTGMGERLGRLEALGRQGITAIPVDRGVEMLLELLERATPVSMVVTGRFGEAGTLAVERPELPLRRFLERPRLFYPGVELIAESELSEASDPYLAEHVFSGERLLPAVLGLEAMAQAFRALTGAAERPVFRDVRFERPIAVPEGATVTLRLAGLVRRPGEVELVLRSDRTSFQVDHFRALCCLPEPREPTPPVEGAAAVEPVPVDPLVDLYGRVLFQAGRFRRLRRYRRLSATLCEAEIAPAEEPAKRWFSPYLSGELELGDPAGRDASIHAIQASIPHATVLPVGVERLEIGPVDRGGTRRVTARERSRHGGTLVFDVDVRYGDGELAERWHGLRLRVPEGGAAAPPCLAVPLAAVYLERRCQDLVATTDLVLAMENGSDRERRRERALARVLDGGGVLYRADGKPETAGRETEGGRAVSLAHSGELTLAVAGPAAVGCDVELVTHREDEVWRDLLGERRCELWEILMRDDGEEADTAATRIWTVLESLKKAGQPDDAPLVLAETTKDGWVVLRSGPHLAATVVLPLGGSGQRYAFAVAAKRGEEGA